MERQVNKLLLFVFALLLTGCTTNNVVDVNIAVPDNSWMYAKSVKAELDIKDSTVAYNVFFKLRNTTDYRYSNIYVVMRIKGEGLSKSNRYQFQLAKADGQWLGKGSGDIYSNVFPLLQKFRFPKNAKYHLEIEQNMRDNPLTGISDVGLTVEQVVP